MDEERPTRPAARLFYGREEAAIEELLQSEARAYPDLELYVVRPPAARCSTSTTVSP